MTHEVCLPRGMGASNPRPLIGKLGGLRAPFLISSRIRFSPLNKAGYFLSRRGIFRHYGRKSSEIGGPHDQ
jgi:hypothetical protein